MFHWKDNLFFGRRADGGVRVLKFDKAPAKWPQADQSTARTADFWPTVDVTIPAAEWASIVSSVAAAGGTAVSYEKAVGLHG